MQKANRKVALLASTLLFITVAASLLYVFSSGIRNDIQWWQTGNEGSYALYLKAWSQGKHAAEAAVRYEKQVWGEAQSANTVKGYKRYLLFLPEGTNGHDATSRIYDLQHDERPYARLYSAALKSDDEELRKKLPSEYPCHVLMNRLKSQEIQGHCGFETSGTNSSESAESINHSRPKHRIQSVPAISPICEPRPVGPI